MEEDCVHIKKDEEIISAVLYTWEIEGGDIASRLHGIIIRVICHIMTYNEYYKDGENVSRESGKQMNHWKTCGAGHVV